MQISVTHVALACCAMEVSTAMALDLPTELDNLHIRAADGQAADLHVLVVAGTITSGSLDRLESVWAELPEPRTAIAYGVCASSGGPYWDSYAVVESAITMSRFVPGCPPPLSTLVDAIVAVAREQAA
jgi:NADH-quinone oxidoreductase subunit B